MDGVDRTPYPEVRQRVWLKGRLYTQYGLGKGEGQNLFIGLDGKKKTFDGLNFPVSEDAQLEVFAAIELINCTAETVLSGCSMDGAQCSRVGFNFSRRFCA